MGEVSGAHCKRMVWVGGVKDVPLILLHTSQVLRILCIPWPLRSGGFACWYVLYTAVAFGDVIRTASIGTAPVLHSHNSQVMVFVEVAVLSLR